MDGHGDHDAGELLLKIIDGDSALGAVAAPEARSLLDKHSLVEGGRVILDDGREVLELVVKLHCDLDGVLGADREGSRFLELELIDAVALEVDVVGLESAGGSVGSGVGCLDVVERVGVVAAYEGADLGGLGVDHYRRHHGSDCEVAAVGHHHVVDEDDRLVVVFIEESDIDLLAFKFVKFHLVASPIVGHGLLLVARQETGLEHNLAIFLHAVDEVLVERTETVVLLEHYHLDLVGLVLAIVLTLESKIAVFVEDVELRDHHPVLALSGGIIHRMAGGAVVVVVFVADGEVPGGVVGVETNGCHIVGRLVVVALIEEELAE